MRPTIKTKVKHPSGVWEIIVQTDGVEYRYLIPDSFDIQKVLRKKLFQMKDWNTIKKRGRLIEKTVYGEKNIDDEFYE